MQPRQHNHPKPSVLAVVYMVYMLTKGRIMKVSSLVKSAVAVVVLSGACVAANAQTNTVLGPVSFLVPTTFGGFAPVGAFIDTFQFSLPANGGSGYAVANFTPPPLAGVFNTLFASMALFSDPDGILFNGDESAGPFASSAGTGTLSLSLPSNAGGHLILLVAGATNGSVGGLYTGAISVTAPVPEPESYAMLLAGLGVMGAIAIRRNKSKSD